MLMAGLLLFPGGGAAEPPALPAGLGGVANPDEDSREQPPVPAGLEGLASQQDAAGEPDLPAPAAPTMEATSEPRSFRDSLPDWLGLTGFLESRAGFRLQNDPHEKNSSIGEARVQLEADAVAQGFVVELTTDMYYDWVTGDTALDLEQGRGYLDIRKACVGYSPFSFMDVKVGRQILTWGTGDLIFINDLFPKDWQSFFIGRDDEYLKAPSDAAKISFYTGLVNVDVVYTPNFDADRYVTGRRLSYWNGSAVVGRNDIVRVHRPDDWFSDDELALRLSKNVSGYELALYGYVGYWKSPAGQDPVSMKRLFPRLSVYGASLRGQVGSGIGYIELGYYDSRDDRSGRDPFINNSQMRYLAGYEQDLPGIANDLTFGMQYYVEQTLRFNRYRRALPQGNKAVKEYRQLVTLRITRLFFNQNLTCSLFAYISPTDSDLYFRPSVGYKLNDHVLVELGGNIFAGAHRYTFFGQFRDNTNGYAAVRYSF
ncbi:MAG: hypothetical protein JW832_10600 [Deltaproteobacteria bacterium]|nr:hypothetical protein [Deltaproteobacteria bacterium]